jgi:phage tail-like protein
MGGLLLKKEKPGKPQYPTNTPLGDFLEMPIPSYQFSLEIDNVTVALFQTCTGMEVKRETLTINEGGLNGYSLELPGQMSFGHVTFSAGLSSSDFYWKWMMTGQLDGWIQARNIILTQFRPSPNEYKPVRKWNFQNAYPVSWKISDLDVSNTEKIVIESLELSFDYFETLPMEPPPPPNPPSLR